MSGRNSIAIIGYSGHAFVVLDAAKEAGFNINYYCDRSKVLSNPFNLKYLGNENDIDFDWNVVDSFIIGIGDNNIRQKVAKLISTNNKEILNIIHPTAVISRFVNFGSGNFVSANVTVNTLAKVGSLCILNTGCIVEHECTIEDGVHIAPGSVLAGNVYVGENSFIGANTVVKQGIKIGENVVVGAGSVVVKDIPDGETWIGNPAKYYK
ncbi:NeuD/PglB/VioB family sugar acetyltransferase [Elizabethkingia meningoseptica]